MKKIIISIFCFIVFVFPIAAQSLTEKANAEYEKDRYTEALSLYLQAAKEEGTSSDFYYNIGNTYYRLGDLGRAVLNYERALILNPGNEEARTNLDFVKTKIQTRITEEKSFVIQVIADFVDSSTSNTWAIIAAVSFVLLVIGIFLYIFSSIIILRKIGFFGGGVMLLFTAISLACAFTVKSKNEAKNKAVVVSPSVTLSTVPRIPKDKTEEAFILTSGNKVTIVDSVSNKNGDTKEIWYDVKVDASHRAWLKSENVEKI